MSQANFFAAVQAGDAPVVARLIAADPALPQAKNERGASGVLLAGYNGRKEIRSELERVGDFCRHRSKRCSSQVGFRNSLV